MALALAACSSAPSGEKTVGVAQGFFGGVAADEPRAALVGRDILKAGGNAVDAATAVYFALAVTLPSKAALGGGGVCLVNDPESRRTVALNFLAGTPASIPASATRPSAVPGNARGFMALHSKYGHLHWAQVVAPGENLARFGAPVSRAFARDLAAVEGALMAEPESRRVFGRRDGSGAVREGDMLVQPDLAAVLAKLRREGGGGLYAGPLAERLVTAVGKARGSLTLKDLADYAPTWRPAIHIPWGHGMIHFAPPPAAAGAVAAEMWTMLTLGDRYEDAPREERPHMLVEAALRAFADRGRWLADDGSSLVKPSDLVSESRIAKLMSTYRPDSHVPAAQLDPAPVARLENPAATSFVTVDADGQAVACALTMNNLFGTGRVAPDTGILLAAVPGRKDNGSTSLGPMMATSDDGKDFFFAAAASGGVAAPTALMNVAVRTLISEHPLGEAMAAKRLHHGGLPDLVYYEQGLDAGAVKSLTDRGHTVAPTTTLGVVNAVSCPDSLPDKPDTCSIKADPRGYGLATSVLE